MDSSKNLMVSRGEKSVWDRPSFSASLTSADHERWLMAAWGSAMAMLGARKGGFSGGMAAMVGSTLAIRAAMGKHDLHVARRVLKRAVSNRWGANDPVADASEESFPASDSPAWTGVSGASPNK
jgi:uncharacterized membrane protein